MRARFDRSWFAVVVGIALAGASCGEEDDHFRPQPDPELGATSFISAASPAGQDFTGPRADAPTDTNEGGEGRTIEEGDIYRVLGAGRVLNLNAYRGLQVLDVSDPRAPAVIGALRTAGSPVELYALGDHALVLMNDWHGYVGTPTSSEVGREQGGVVLLVDLSDPTEPVVLDRAVVPGYLMRSRLARGDADVLYVAASLWQLYDGGAVASGDRTVVKSVAIAETHLTPMSELDLGGWVSDIAATPEALMVARSQWDQDGVRSAVALVDIADVGGTMSLGADIPVAGQVKNQFNMDLRGGILRVVSEGAWGDGANHLQTFDVADAAKPRAVDHEVFGAGQSLFATLFVGPDKGFFVTYLRQDPFHAFYLGPDGQAEARSEFIVSGWNDFFRATFDDTRLLGVGIDDTGGKRDLALSLYDITDLSAKTPLITRETAALDSAWSEASWDHRAFTVLEDAVSVPAEKQPTVTETGLVMLPFSGWDEGGYVSGVQLFTFSATTITARGVLAHETPVRRSFLVGDEVGACLSDVSLALHDLSNPDAPALLGEVELAPNYPEVTVYGAYALRHRETAGWTWWGSHEPTPGRAEVVSLARDPDRAPALASFEVPAGASITQVGDLAVVMSGTWQIDAEDPKGGAWQTTIDVWDLAAPTSPVHRGTLVTRDLPPYWSGWYYGVERPAMDCLDCGGGYGRAPRGTVVGEAIAFLEGVYESAPAGVQRYCVTSVPGSGEVEPVEPSEPPDPARDANDEVPKVWYTGRIECVSQDGGPETCYGQIYACSGLEVECVEVADPESVGAETECKEEPTYRYWTRWIVHVLDLSNPMAPAVTTPIELPTVEEGIAVLADGETLWVATREPVEVEGDGRAYMRYWARPVDLGTPAAPAIGARVNVPGVLLAVDGHDLYTLDYVYDDDHVESAVSRLTLLDGVARLDARHRVDDRQVEVVRPDGAGHVLVSHGPIYWWYGYDVATTGTTTNATETWETRLTILDTEHLSPLSTTPIASWAMLRWAGVGRALFQVPGGLLVMNTMNPTAPTPQAFFATAGWPEEVVVSGRQILFAGGLYGIYSFLLDDYTLFAP